MVEYIIVLAAGLVYITITLIEWIRKRKSSKNKAYIELQQKQQKEIIGARELLFVHADGELFYETKNVAACIGGLTENEEYYNPNESVSGLQNIFYVPNYYLKKK